MNVLTSKRRSGSERGRRELWPQLLRPDDAVRRFKRRGGAEYEAEDEKPHFALMVN